MAGTTTVPDLNHGDFLDAPFVAPNISEQQSIVDYLNAQSTRIDKSIEKQERQIKLIKEYRTTLISEVVTGKIDVRDSGEHEVRHS
jgi:type I restriction enzyme S subunit